MNHKERTHLLDELTNRCEGEALARIHSDLVNCVRFCTKQRATAEQIQVAKAATLELSLIAEGGMVALGAYPVYGSVFGTLGRRARA
jgi:hypothetical protein